MNAYVPPWLTYGPESNASSISSGLGAATRFAEINEQHDKDQAETLQRGMEDWQKSRLEMANLQQQKQQFQTSTALDLMKINAAKQESDRQYQLQLQEKQNQIALAKQTMDLKAQDAARQFQWNQQFQQRVKQLTTPPSITSADAAGADIAGAPAPSAGAGMDPSEAASRALSELGPPPGESMAGYGTSLKAMAPARIPAPPGVVVDPRTGDKAWQYGGRIVPIKPPADSSEKEQAEADKSEAEQRKDKIAFVNQFLKNFPDKSVYDATEAWDKVVGEGDEKPEASGPSEGSDNDDLPFKIIKLDQPK